MIVQGSLCLDPLPSILVQNFGMVSLGKGSSLRRVAMDGYDISWIQEMSARQPTRQGCTGKRPRGQRTPSHHVTLQSKDAMASIQSFSWSSSSLPLTLVPLDLVQLHLFLMIQLSMVILETHTVWIRHISTKDGKMETCRIRPETKTVQILLSWMNKAEKKYVKNHKSCQDVSKWLKWTLGRRPGHRSIWTVFVFDGYDLFPSFRLWWR